MSTNNENSTIKAKFIAVMVDSQTKDAIVALRDETKLSEKELMALILRKVQSLREEILAEAAQINEAYEASKLGRKKERYEALKVTQKEVRAAARVLMADKAAAASNTAADESAKV